MGQSRPRDKDHDGMTTLIPELQNESCYYFSVIHRLHSLQKDKVDTMLHLLYNNRKLLNMIQSKLLENLHFTPRKRFIEKDITLGQVLKDISKMLLEPRTT